MKNFALLAVLASFLTAVPAHAVLTGNNGSTVSGTSGVVGAQAENAEAEKMKAAVEADEKKAEEKKAEQEDKE
jgi:hypothetical protein